MSPANVTTFLAVDFATPALTADLAAEHDRLTLFESDLQALLGPDPTASFNLGTVGGRNVTLSKNELLVLDQMMFAALDGVRTSPLQNGVDSGQQLAAAGQANPTVANFKELLAGETASSALSVDTLETIADVMYSCGLQLQIGVVGASAVQPELLATPLPYLLFGSGLIIQSVGMLVDPANADVLGELRGSVDSLRHYAKSQLDGITSQATGLIHDAMSAQAVTSNDVQKAGPAGQILVSGGPDVTIHEVIGDEAAVEVRLTKKPQGVVSINLTNGDPSRGELSPSILVFTPDNWWLPQRVSITALDTQTADGNHNFAITLSPAQSTMPDYQGVPSSPSQINVTDINDNHAGVVVTPAGGLVTTEDRRLGPIHRPIDQQAPGAGQDDLDQQRYERRGRYANQRHVRCDQLEQASRIHRLRQERRRARRAAPYTIIIGGVNSRGFGVQRTRRVRRFGRQRRQRSSDADRRYDRRLAGTIHREQPVGRTSRAA